MAEAISKNTQELFDIERSLIINFFFFENLTLLIFYLNSFKTTKIFIGK